MINCSLKDANKILAANHYLGAARRGFGLIDENGVLVFANPSSRRLPQRTWLELVRWCITSDEYNAGSRQWANAWRWLFSGRPEVTTIVSYSDPRHGHTGSLYRASNWFWAPTWHRLRPPPSGNGSWKPGGGESTKDRWIFPLRDDSSREEILFLNDSTLAKRFPWAVYKEGVGANYKRFKKEILQCP